eukprot:51569-Rhodomonas_salina.1
MSATATGRMSYHPSTRILQASQHPPHAYPLTVLRILYDPTRTLVGGSVLTHRHGTRSSASAFAVECPQLTHQRKRCPTSGTDVRCRTPAARSKPTRSSQLKHHASRICCKRSRPSQQRSRS